MIFSVLVMRNSFLSWTPLFLLAGFGLMSFSDSGMLHEAYRMEFLALAPSFILIFAFVGLIVSGRARPLRKRWTLLSRRLIGVPILTGYAALVIYGFCKFMLCMTPIAIGGWINVIFLSLLQFFWIWRIFLYPDHPRGDGGGGNRSRRPRPSKGPSDSKLKPTREVAAPVL